MKICRMPWYEFFVTYPMGVSILAILPIGL